MVGMIGSRKSGASCGWFETCAMWGMKGKPAPLL